MRLAVFSWLCLLGVWSCSVEPNDPKSDPQENRKPGAADVAWDGVRLRVHRDAPSALRFPVPVTGYRVRATHFDPSTPPGKMKHELTFVDDHREVVRIEVWNDTDGLGLNAFFAEYLGFMATPNSVVESSRASRQSVPAIVVKQPRSEQSPPRRSLIFALDDRILRVTAIDDSDARSSALLDRVASALETDGAN